MFVCIMMSVTRKAVETQLKEQQTKVQNSLSKSLSAGRSSKRELYLCAIHHGLKLSSRTLIKGWTIRKHCYYGESVMILALKSFFPISMNYDQTAH